MLKNGPEDTRWTINYCDNVKGGLCLQMQRWLYVTRHIFFFFFHWTYQKEKKTLLCIFKIPQD